MNSVKTISEVLTRQQRTIKYMAKVIDTLQEKVQQMEQGEYAPPAPDDTPQSTDEPYTGHPLFAPPGTYSSIEEQLQAERNYYRRQMLVATKSQREHLRRQYNSATRQLFNY